MSKKICIAETKKDLDVINPSTEESFAVISLGTKADVDIAVKSAEFAFQTWKETSKKDRLELIENLLKI